MSYEGDAGMVSIGQHYVNVKKIISGSTKVGSNVIRQIFSKSLFLAQVVQVTLVWLLTSLLKTCEKTRTRFKKRDTLPYQFFGIVLKSNQLPSKLCT